MSSLIAQPPAHAPAETRTAPVRRRQITFGITLPWTSWMALILLTLWTVPAVAGATWGPLGTIQKNDTYRTWSGVLLFAYLAYQWLLPLHRMYGNPAKAKAQYWRHTLIGSLSPLLFLGHASQVGYGYLAALSLLFVVNTAIGAVHPGAFQTSWKHFRSVWMSVHVVLSLLLTALAAFHVFVVYGYS